MKDTILERGKFIRTRQTPENLAFFPENRLLIADLFKRFRFEMIFEDKDNKEWVVIGTKGQLFEYGRGLLGISVEGSKRASEFIRQTKSFTSATQHGDGETNLKCEWTAENVDRLARLLGLFKRRTDSAKGLV